MTTILVTFLAILLYNKAFHLRVITLRQKRDLSFKIKLYIVHLKEKDSLVAVNNCEKLKGDDAE